MAGEPEEWFKTLDSLESVLEHATESQVDEIIEVMILAIIEMSAQKESE